MGLLENIREDAKKSGQNKGKFLYVRDGSKLRVRFLQDMQDGFEVPFHDSFELGINVPCREYFGKTCPYCEEEGIRTRNLYAWSVWDYEAKEVKVLMYAMNNCTPIASIASMYENYGTLLDRDYVIQRNGKQQNTTYTVIPMDKQKFRNEKAKPFSKSGFLKILDKAFPDEHSEKFGSDSNDEENDYSEMSAKELYKLCEERGIEAEPKMKQKYYIDLLEEYDANNKEDDWDEDETNSQYEGKSAKELYKLCKERDIEAEPKKTEKYYINLLEEDDKAHDDWDDEDDDAPWDDDEKLPFGDKEEDEDDEWEDE